MSIQALHSIKLENYEAYKLFSREQNVIKTVHKENATKLLNLSRTERSSSTEMYTALQAKFFNHFSGRLLKLWNINRHYNRFLLQSSSQNPPHIHAEIDFATSSQFKSVDTETIVSIRLIYGSDSNHLITVIQPFLQTVITTVTVLHQLVPQQQTSRLSPSHTQL